MPPPPAPEYLTQAFSLADRLSACAFSPSLGVFAEQLWQSGATLESVSSVLLLPQLAPRLRSTLTALLNASFAATPVIVDVRAPASLLLPRVSGAFL